VKHDCLGLADLQTALKSYPRLQLYQPPLFLDDEHIACLLFAGAEDPDNVLKVSLMDIQAGALPLFDQDLVVALILRDPEASPRLGLALQALLGDGTVLLGVAAGLHVERGYACRGLADKL